MSVPGEINTCQCCLSYAIHVAIWYHAIYPLLLGIAISAMLRSISLSTIAMCGLLVVSVYPAFACACVYVRACVRACVVCLSYVCVCACGARVMQVWCVGVVVFGKMQLTIIVDI